jgi:hypothetical protein
VARKSKKPELETELEEELDLADEGDLSEEALQKEPLSLELEGLEVEEELKTEPVVKAPRKRVEKVAVEKAAEALPVPAAAAAPAPAPDPVVAQWEAAAKTTQAIVASLENVHAMLKDLPEHYAAVVQKSLKQQPAKPSQGTRLAFATSFLAIVFSVLSLSFSQSVRNQVIMSKALAPSAATRIDSNLTKEREAELLATVPKPKKRKLK